MRIQFTCTAPSSSSSTHPTHPTTINPNNNLEGKDVTDEIRGDQEDVCGHRNQHEFSRQSFESGIVLVQCPNCLNRHLIADNLQWFTSNPTSDDPNFRMDLRNIVEIMRSKGEVVRRGSSN
ncbi:DNL zinc finger-domain-containing protein [Phakopsora pachyrhizi]|uniref:DNL zinc finger-domain-containing protein n=1 Tax=Phakopsora pachyrhizi TaxID=170000 RepID=A0AAV0B3M0_PHAPC|nr:DNL zinc finger-domain-containing protein [Phakopsora pachyrhizi]CAH7676608.1 DNL zinc finger-domain-containing protein [Phakopsora pachyrhizi]